jgi:hypothetical protein
MLQKHSLLWHYLWVAPNVLLLVLGFVTWKRGTAKQIPAFLVFACLSAISELAVYAADVTPAITGWTFFRIVWAILIIEAVLKFALIGEIFARVFGSFASIARLGKLLIRAVSVVFALVATLAAAYAPQDGRFGIISGAHFLDQTIYLIESGLLVFIFLFASYFHLSWTRAVFGISLGLSISACVHLATWAILANGGLPDPKRVLLVFVNMATYHLSVVVWFYYLLIPQKVAVKCAVPLPENNLAVWNRELERLLQQ